MTDASIVIPVWAYDHRLQTVWEEAREAYRQNSSGARLIVIDNESTPPLPEADYRAEPNIGYCRAVNKGLEMADTTWMIVGSCDIIVPPGWLPPLLRRGITSPTESDASIAHHGRIDRAEWNRRFGSFFGSLFAIHRDVYEAIGGMDESWLNMGDRDYAVRAALAGFPVEMAYEVEVFHREPSRGTVEATRKPDRLRDTARFRDMWGAESFGEWERKR